MLTKLIPLFVMDVGQLLVEVLGELKDIPVIDPPYSGECEGKPLKLLVCRIVKLGSTHPEDKSYEMLAENDLVLIRACAGYELIKGGLRFRSIERTDIFTALHSDDLERAQITPEDLIVMTGEQTLPAATQCHEQTPAPPPMIGIEFINAKGLGFAHSIQVREGITLAELLAERGINASTRALAVLRGGEELTPTASLVIEEGDHVEALPLAQTGFAQSEADANPHVEDEDEDSEAIA